MLKIINSNKQQLCVLHKKEYDRKREALSLGGGYPHVVRLLIERSMSEPHIMRLRGPMMGDVSGRNALSPLPVPSHVVQVFVHGVDGRR
jgi:hypothetical protein